MARPYRSRLVSSEREIASLSSPARVEIVDVLAQMGKASVAEIAATLGRAPDSLYYHVRALEKAGLVLRAGVRGRGRREEALYKTVAPELKLKYDPGSPANVRGSVKLISSLLRLGSRDFRRAFEAGNVVVEGPRRELWAMRVTGWLSSREIARVNRLIHDLKNTVSHPPTARGRLYAVTVLLVPLDRGRKKAARKAGSRDLSSARRVPGVRGMRRSASR